MSLLILYMAPVFTKNIHLSDCLIVTDVNKVDTVHMMLAALVTQKNKGFTISGTERLNEDRLSQTIKTHSSNFVNSKHLKNIKNHMVKGQLYVCYQKK